MKTGDILTLDATAKKPPFFLERDTDPIEKGYIKGEVKTIDNEVWECDIIRISTSGKYTVKLTEKIH